MKIKLHNRDKVVVGFAQIDDADADLAVRGWNRNSGGYVQGRVDGRMRYLHDLVTEAAYGQKPQGMVVDHKNGDKTDNRRSNLRYVTQQENAQNRRGPNSTSTSGYRGVSWDCFWKCWQAHLTIDRKKITVGKFKTREAANAAVTKARAELMSGVNV